MARLRLSQINLWQKHATAVIDIIRRAADLMITNGDRGLEPDLNRQLVMYMFHVIRTLEEQGIFVPSGYPILEALNQPTPGTQGTTSEGKRPDVQWGYRDSQVANPMEAARIFHIECKRIGTSTLDPLYVKEGIARFIDQSWRYGKDVDDGAMVGYVEQKGPDAALVAVNFTSSAAGIPLVAEVSRHGARLDLEQELARDFAKSPFRLHHVWVDTRSSRSLPTSHSSTGPQNRSSEASYRDE
jgi:hypothetical protein